METSAVAQSASDRYPQVASPVHTILVLAVLGGWSFWHKISAEELSVAANPNRIRFYLETVVYEWLLFVLVVAGVKRSGASVLIVLGDHWRILQPSAAGYWNRRWPLDRCGDPPLDIRLASTRRSAGSQCVHAPSARSRTDSMDRALNYRRHLRGDNLSRLPATAVHGSY